MGAGAGVGIVAALNAASSSEMDVVLASLPSDARVKLKAALTMAVADTVILARLLNS